MRHADDGMAFGVLVADQEPSRDQRIDKSRLRRRSGHLGKRGWAGRNRLVAQAHRGQARSTAGNASWMSGGSASTTSSARRAIAPSRPPSAR